MCAPEFNNIQVPTPIIINGIAFDEEDLDPVDFEFEEEFDFDEVASDDFPLVISESDSFESLVNYEDLLYSDSEDSENTSDEGESSAAVAFQERLYSYHLVNHSVLRTYDSVAAINYSNWIYENWETFPVDLDIFIEVQLGIIFDIIATST